jgi:NTP pyrophosphatase (non-canonical NTP hydrolase)
MNFKEYQEFVWEIASETSRQDFEHQIGTAGLGLAGEAGEVADIAKKVLFQGKEFDREDFISEAGDVLWYLAFAATMCETSLEEIMNGNVTKLQDRFKSGKFSVEEFQAKEAAKCPSQDIEKPPT